MMTTMGVCPTMVGTEGYESKGNLSAHPGSVGELPGRVPLRSNRSCFGRTLPDLQLKYWMELRATSVKYH